MPKSPGLTAIGVLLGGSSRRMGRPKHELTLPDGRTLLETMLDLATSLCDNIMLCGEGDCNHPLPRVYDTPGVHGPLAGIEALLRTVVNGRCLVLPCDMPALETTDLKRLAAAEGPLALFASDSDSKMRSMPLLIDAELLPQLHRSIESDQRALHEFIQSQPHDLIEPPADTTTLMNLNTPEDLQRWVRAKGGSLEQ
ncbi:MAG: molybdenum cofactor guanylyltransferase [Phycisphaerales bacterium]|nr:molybdenum cofactor guanylyltransferase [Phycisphaerales bacterium]